MSLTLSPLDKTKHRELRLKPDTTFSFAHDQCMIPVYVTELYYAGNNFPIFFAKTADNSAFDCVALVGLEPGENIVFNRSRPATTYVPQQLTHQPFYCLPHPEQSEQMMVCIDESSPRLSQSDGEALFHQDQSPTPFLENLLKQLANQSKLKWETEQFVSYLLKHQLLEEAKLDITTPTGEKKRLNGLYRVSRDRLQLLADDVILDMHRRGLLAAVHAHLNSHGQIPRLLALRGTKP